MKALIRVLLFQAACFLMFQVSALPLPRVGFYLPDSIREVTFTFKSMQNLVVLPVTINDTIHVNLILDTGCRNLVLFGKRFQKLLTLQPNYKVQFSGLGAGKPIQGSLSLNNKVSIDAVLGERIPVVVVPRQHIFGLYNNIHGVIGYDLFTKFEVEIVPDLRQITLRPAATADLPASYTRVPIRVEDSRPLIDCKVIFSDAHSHLCNLMIDTGSTLGLLLKTSELGKYPFPADDKVLGLGLNGPINGLRTITERLQLNGLEIKSIDTGIMHSPWHNYASLGMDVLRRYSLVLNYCKSYAGFRPL